LCGQTLFRTEGKVRVRCGKGSGHVILGGERVGEREGERRRKRRKRGSQKHMPLDRWDWKGVWIELEGMNETHQVAIAIHAYSH